MAEQQADRIYVTYYTDPLCCWSWGMEPQLRKFRYQYRHLISFRYCMAGLIPEWKNFTDTANDVSRPAQMGPIWMEAAHMTGMPIHNRIWMDNPPASSYLSCIAVKCAALQSLEAEEAYLRHLRETVMAEGKNIALQSVLIEAAHELANQHPSILNFDKFSDDLQNGHAIEAFRSDLLETQSLRITRFPTLVFRKAGQPALVLTGHNPFSALETVMVRLGNDQMVMPDIEVDGYIKFWGTLTPRESHEIE